MKNQKFNNIAKLIRNLRASNNISQQELSFMLGFKNGQFVSNIERAKCSIPFASIPTMAKALKADQSRIIEAVLDDMKLTIDAVCEENQPKVMSMFENSDKASVLRISGLPLSPNFRDYL